MSEGRKEFWDVKRMKGRGLALGMALLMGVSGPAFAATAQDLQKAKEKKQEIQGQIESQKGRISTTRGAVEATSEELKALDQEVTRANAQIDQLTGEIVVLQGDILKTRQELDAARESLKNKQEQFGERLKVMYTSGSAGVLDVIFNAKDVESLLTNFDMLKLIARQDRDLVESIKSEITTIEEKETKLAGEEAKLQEKRRGVEENRQALQDATKKKEEYMAALEGDLKGFEAQYDAMLAQSDEIEAQIKKIQNDLAEQARLKKLREEAARRQARNQAVTQLPLGATPAVRSNKSLMWPVPGHTSISSPFGYRIHPILGYRKFHSGVDIPAPAGTPIVAVKDGVVITATFMGGYGNVIMIDHGDKVTVYAHNSVLKVKTGDVVKAGQVISLCGSTGMSTGPHLHFEVRINGSVVDPLGYI